MKLEAIPQMNGDGEAMPLLTVRREAGEIQFAVKVSEAKQILSENHWAPSGWFLDGAPSLGISSFASAGKWSDPRSLSPKSKHKSEFDPELNHLEPLLKPKPFFFTPKTNPYSVSLSIPAMMTKPILQVVPLMPMEGESAGMRATDPLAVAWVNGID
jgi:hypothetical protein